MGVSFRISIAHKLPLLISGLLLVLMLAGSWAAYREVRGSALEANRERLERMARQLAGRLDTGVATRTARMAAISGNGAVRALLDTGVQSAEAAEALAPLLDVRDSLPVELRVADDVTVSRAGRFPSDWGPAQIDSVRRAATGPGPGYSEIRVVGGRPYVWVVAPVETNGIVKGAVAQLVAIGDTAAGEPGELLGAGLEIYYVNRSGGPWISLDGTPIPAPFPDPTSAPAVHARTFDGAAATAFVASANGSPLAIVAETPLASVLAAPHAFLRRALLGSLLLTFLGAAGAWLLSRRITRPLRDLAHASHELSADRRPRVVAVDRTDELGELADAFNRMADEIRENQAALRLQIDEARSARAEAETASRAKSQFLATMSHEIRTPINAIIGYTDLLLLGVPERVSVKQRAQMERIHASGQYLLRLIDEVLDLSRIEEGRLIAAEEAGDAYAAIDAALEVTAQAAAQRTITIVRPHDDEGPRFLGDSRRVEQILVNLLSNAIKFTPVGGRVECTARHAGDSVVFVVTDNGIGISADQLDRIFEPFVQADQGYTRSYGGVGLGLAISRELARIMDGDITVESAPDRGSTFQLRLPSVATGIEAA